MQANTKKQKFEFATDEEKITYLKEVIGFFQDERGEEIGLVAAEKFLDFFLNSMGEKIYKKAIKDTKKIIREKLEDLDFELDSLSEK